MNMTRTVQAGLTVMIYAKLYPGTFVEAYRRHVRGLDQAVHGAEVLRAPIKEEWETLSRSCDLRDMAPMSAGYARGQCR